MDMFEEARSIRAMLSLGKMTQCRIAEALGVSQPYVANKLRLLAFSEEEQAKILEYGLSERHARTILRLPSINERLAAIEKAYAMKMNVARCEIMVDTKLDELCRTKLSSEMNSAERIGYFEAALESSLSILREHGIRARSKREERESFIYFTVCIG